MNMRQRPAFWMSVVYFWFYAGIACWGPYVVLYYQHIGLSGAQIGMLNAIIPLGMAFFAPFWSSMADLRGAHRALLTMALLATAGVAALLSSATSFWMVLPLILVFALLGTTASPIIDSYGVTIGAQQGMGFGQLRLWGSIGYTMVVWIIGAAMGGTVTTLFLWCYAACLLLTGLAVLGLPKREKSLSQSRWAGASALLRRMDVRVLLFTVFLLAISSNGVFALFGIYVAQMGGSTALLGVASAVAAISELPILFLGRRLTARLGSRKMLIVALSFFCMRIGLYSLIPSAPWILAVQVLHSFSFGMYLMASVTMMNELVEQQFAATAQSLLASAMAFGQMSGAIINGILLDWIGILDIYRVATLIMLVALAAFIIGSRRTNAAEASRQTA